MTGSDIFPIDILGIDMPPRFGWRWAFLMQIPLFIVSFFLTGANLRYVTPVSLIPLVYTLFCVSEELVKGKGNSTKEVLKRIDYGGSFTLFGSVSLSVRYRSVPLTLRTRWVVCSFSSAISTTMSCLGIHLR